MHESPPIMPHYDIWQFRYIYGRHIHTAIKMYMSNWMHLPALSISVSFLLSSFDHKVVYLTICRAARHYSTNWNPNCRLSNWCKKVSHFISSLYSTINIYTVANRVFCQILDYSDIMQKRSQLDAQHQENKHVKDVSINRFLHKKNNKYFRESKGKKERTDYFKNLTLSIHNRSWNC